MHQQQLSSSHHLIAKKEKDPLFRAKGMSVLGKTEIAHIFDRESEDPVHV